uniref:Reverse transcriptase domain-containing protein n=1 Tax=Tanacetum cinerariifolium TaxID=118510 RepID=A0A6L2LAQ2_TANCI|nr:reverse transcriptase domain-containing protein [Tanacetum cinerariifolium]
MKDVRQRGRGNQMGNTLQQAKIINMIRVRSEMDKKRKTREQTESWMNVSITFPLVSSEYIYEEPIIVEAELEGYLVQRVYVDE